MPPVTVDLETDAQIEQSSLKFALLKAAISELVKEFGMQSVVSAIAAIFNDTMVGWRLTTFQVDVPTEDDCF